MLFIKVFENFTSEAVVGRCACDLLISISFLIFQMTAIKEALTRFYGVIPKIQCLPPEEVKTPLTPQNGKKKINKKITSFFKEHFFQKIAKKFSKNRVKNLWWNLGLGILCAYICFYIGIVWFLDLRFKGLFVLKGLNLHLLHEWCNHHARGIAVAEHFPPCLLKFNCCMADD